MHDLSPHALMLIVVVAVTDMVSADHFGGCKGNSWSMGLLVPRTLKVVRHDGVVGHTHIMSDRLLPSLPAPLSTEAHTGIAKPCKGGQPVARATFQPKWQVLEPGLLEP